MRKLACAVILTALTSPVSAQIISTSIPTGTQPGAGKKTAFHIMGGYASWGFADLKNLEKADPDFKFTTPNGVLLAGDFVYQTSDNVAVGLGGWYNRLSFSGDISAGSQSIRFAEATGDLFSGYGNVFYKKIGAQVGFVRVDQQISVPAALASAVNVPTETTATSTDLNYHVVGRFGSDRWSMGIGVGGYTYGDKTGNIETDSADEGTSLSAFANLSIKVVKNLSLDAGVWYIGESALKDDAATRLTVGLGYTF